MAGKRARVVIASALLLSMTGCQSWFYYPKADVLSKWEDFRKEGAQVELYLEPEPGAEPKPASEPRAPPERRDLALLLPATPPLVRGFESSGSGVTEVDVRRVSHALVRRYDPDKSAHNALIGLWIVGTTAGIAGMTFLIVFGVSLRGLGADHGR